MDSTTLTNRSPSLVPWPSASSTPLRRTRAPCGSPQPASTAASKTIMSRGGIRAIPAPDRLTRDIQNYVLGSSLQPLAVISGSQILLLGLHLPSAHRVRTGRGCRLPQLYSEISSAYLCRSTMLFIARRRSRGRRGCLAATQNNGSSHERVVLFSHVASARRA
jgi:hypothetical protein